MCLQNCMVDDLKGNFILICTFNILQTNVILFFVIEVNFEGTYTCSTINEEGEDVETMEILDMVFILRYKFIILYLNFLKLHLLMSFFWFVGS